MYCTNCGCHLDENAIFCPNCGQKVGRQPRGGQNIMQDFHNSYNSVMSKPKNKIIAGLLAIFLGSMGIHNFYLGFTKKGVIQLLLFVFFLGWISQIWALVDALMIFTGRTYTDARGIPLSDNF